VDELCKCGCRGWCTLFPLLLRLAKDIADIVPELALVLVDVKGDWPAFLELVGLRYWAHKQHPCPVCCCPLEKLNDYAGYTLFSCPYPFYSHDMYIEDLKKATQVTVCELMYTC